MRKQTLAKSSRLLQASDFSNAMHAGSKLRDQLFVVYVVANRHKQARLGVIVSRKISLKAVIRNRIKRQIRESFRIHQGELSGLDIVVSAQRQSANSPGEEQRNSLQRHWQKIVQRCKPS